MILSRQDKDLIFSSTENAISFGRPLLVPAGSSCGNGKDATEKRIPL